MRSGLQKGDDIVPWNPIHVAGPNKGTNACPVCTYMTRPAVVVFAKETPDLPTLAGKLEGLVIAQQARHLKAFLVVLDSTPDRLKQLADQLKIEQIGICYPDPVTRDRDLARYKVNPLATSTAMIYKDYLVTANFVNLEAKDFAQIETAVENLPAAPSKSVTPSE